MSTEKEYREPTRYYAYIPDKNGKEPPLYCGDSIRFDSIANDATVMNMAVRRLGTHRVVLMSYRIFHERRTFKLVIDNGRIPLGERKKS